MQKLIDRVSAAAIPDDVWGGRGQPRICPATDNILVGH